MIFSTGPKDRCHKYFVQVNNGHSKISYSGYSMHFAATMQAYFAMAVDYGCKSCLTCTIKTLQIQNFLIL